VAETKTKAEKSCLTNTGKILNGGY